MATILVTGCDYRPRGGIRAAIRSDGHRVIATCLDPAKASETAAIHGQIEVVAA